MLVTRRELVHRSIADELEMDEDRLKNNYEAVIKHCENSGDLNRTRKYLLKAGMDARNKGVDYDAIHYFSQLIKLDD